MTEELVTLETAKLLKEKGFNEYCKDIIKEDDNRSGYVKPRTCISKYPICMKTIGRMIY